MNYRTLGKSGIRVSEAGIGGHQETVHLDDSPGHAGLWSTNFDGLVPVMAHEDRARQAAQLAGISVAGTGDRPGTRTAKRRQKHMDPRPLITNIGGGPTIGRQRGVR